MTSKYGIDETEKGSKKLFIRPWGNMAREEVTIEYAVTEYGKVIAYHATDKDGYEVFGMIENFIQ